MQGEPPADRPRLGQDDLGTVGAHDGLHAFEHGPYGLSGLDLRAAERTAEVVELLKSTKALRETEVAAVGEHDQSADDEERKNSPAVLVGGVEDDEGQSDTRQQDEPESEELEAGGTLPALTVDANDHRHGHFELPERPW